MNTKSSVVILIPVEHNLELNSFIAEVKTFLDDYRCPVYIKSIMDDTQSIQEIISKSDLTKSSKAVFIPAKSRLQESITESCQYEVYTYQYSGTESQSTKPANINGTLLLDRYVSDSRSNAIITEIDTHVKANHPNNYNTNRTFSIPFFTLEKYDDYDLKEINAIYIAEDYLQDQSRADQSYINHLLHKNPQITPYLIKVLRVTNKSNRQLKQYHIVPYIIPAVPEFTLIHKPGTKINKPSSIENNPFISADIKNLLATSPNYNLKDPSDTVLTWCIKQQLAYKLIQKWITSKGHAAGAYFQVQSFNQVASAIVNAKDDYFKFNNKQFTGFCYRIIADYCKLNTLIVQSNINESENPEKLNCVVLKNPNFEIIIFQNLVHIKSAVSVLGRPTILTTQTSLIEFLVDYIPLSL